MDFDIHLNRPSANLHDILIDPTIPEWKKDLIVRKRNTNRLLFGNLQFACASLGSSISNHNTPTANAIRNDDIEAAAAPAADAILTEEAEQAILVSCHTPVDNAASARFSSPEPEETSAEEAGADTATEVQGEEREEEEEDFHPQEDSPQVNGESDGVGTILGDDDAVDSLSSSAPEPVSPECRILHEGAMRLNNDTDCFPATEKILLNGTKRASNGNNKGHVKRTVLANSNKIMGEEKPKIKSSGRKLSAPPHGTKSVLHTINLGDPEEIKYGPGIVHKLRDRYINITLRESATAYKQRPSLNNLRRASSLDNILDEAPVVRRPPQPEKKQPAKSKEKLSVAEHMKRHRSMETLLFEKQAPLVNEDIVIIETSQPPAAVPTSRKRNSSGGVVASEDEMPPPDVVKQTRQKFERRTNTMPASNKQQGIVASRVANFKKPALSPKPANLDALRRNKDVGTLPPPLSMSPPEISKLLSPVEKQPPVIVSEEPKVVLEKPLSPLPRVSSPKESTPPPRVQAPQDPPPPRVQVPKESPAPKESPPPPRSPSPAKIADDDETCKIISKKALENIRKNGFSFVISPKGSPNLSHLPGNENGSPAPQVISVHQKTQDKQVGVIRPIPKVVNEKNMLNAVKSEQQLIKSVTLRQVTPVPTIPAPAPAPAAVPVVAPVVNRAEPTTELWGSNKRHFNEQPSTQTFDFTTRKSVPDYIENDGIGQRPAPVGEEVDAAAAPNLLALEISFEIVGGNVLINGRSSLQKQPKASKMRIKFDDEAISTFEYPSEASLLIDDTPPAEDAPSQPRGLQPLPSGSGSLASYTPSKIQMSDDTFELGVTRAAAMAPAVNSQSQDEDSFLLKPADEQDTVAWSSESASSDLLF